MLALLNQMFGLPAHPLLVHLPVMLVPVSAVALIAVAVRPAWRPRGGPLVAALAAVTLVSVQLAMSSGESLQHQVGDHALVQRHAELADPLRPLALAVFLISIAILVVDRRRDAANVVTRKRTIDAVLAVLAALVSVGSIVQIARVGHSGAKAVWHDKGTTTAPDRGAGDGD